MIDVAHRIQNFELSSIFSENMSHVIVMEWLKKEKINNNSKRVSDHMTVVPRSTMNTNGVTEN